MTRCASCCVVCAQIFSGTPGPRVLTFVRAAFSFRLFWLHGKEAISGAVSRCILLVFLQVKLPEAHLLPSASHFHVFFFNSTFHFAILSCFNPAETFHSAFRMFVYIRVPPNNAINGSTPSLGPRLSLFSEVSYYKKLV